MAGELEIIAETGEVVAKHAPSILKAAVEVARSHPVGTMAVAAVGVCTLAWIGTRPGVKLKFFGFECQGPDIK